MAHVSGPTYGGATKALRAEGTQPAICRIELFPFHCVPRFIQHHRKAGRYIEYLSGRSEGTIHVCAEVPGNMTCVRITPSIFVCAQYSVLLDDIQIGNELKGFENQRAWTSIVPRCPRFNACSMYKISFLPVEGNYSGTVLIKNL